MRRIHPLTNLLAVALLSCVAVVGGWRTPAQAETANAPSLTISQLKITSSNGQFVMLYNATDTALDMSKYQLEYFNNFDVSKATSSRLITLSGTVPPHGYYMLNDDTVPLCYQLTVNSVSLGFSSTAGMVQVLGLGQSGVGGSVLPTVQDYVGWSKTAASGAQTLPTNTAGFLRRLPLNAQNNPLVSAAGSGSWQVVQFATGNACSLVTPTGIDAGNSVPTNASPLLVGSEPPALIVAADQSTGQPDTASAVFPPADIGLMAPRISELLPNPAGSGSDSEDEFIELYNPNAVAFDLSGFRLQTGTSTTHTYVFPVGSSLAAQSFTAYYSRDTAVTLSNTGSQAKLLDPFGNSLSASEPYTNAKDGQAWALANGKWFWTTTPTPNAANTIKQPVTLKSKRAAAAAAKKTLASKAKAAKAAKSKRTKLATQATGGFSPEEAPRTPIHTGVLVAIGAGALLYGAYEYRADLAGHFGRFRRYLGFGGPDRP